jgi:hypothetical protein
MHTSINGGQWREQVSEILSEADSPKLLESPQKNSFRGETPVRRNTLYSLNRQMDKLSPPYDVNENVVRAKLAEADRFYGKNSPVYWLTVARISELALATAGANADGCEFRTAGDMLVNPSRILVHVKGRRRPIEKNRHGKLSEQLALEAETEGNFVDWFKKNASLEIVEKALIPQLRERIAKTDMIAPSYIEEFEKKSKRIADAIGFLCAWKIEDAEQLHARMRAASAETRKFVHANLCGFDDVLYKRIGRDIRGIEKGLGYRGEILSATAVEKMGKRRKRRQETFNF